MLESKLVHHILANNIIFAIGICGGRTGVHSVWLVAK
jgi:hypothetical protein